MPLVYSSWLMKLLIWLQGLPQNALRAAAAALVLAGLILLYSATGKAVEVVVGGQVVELRTHAGTVGDALRDAGMEPTQYDKVAPSADAQLSSGDVIHLDRAHPIVLEVDGDTQTVFTPETAPANVLAAAGLKLYPGDRLWVDGRRLLDPTQLIEERPSHLAITRAKRIRLDQDGEVRLIYSAAPTLGEALWEAGIVLHDGDRIVPAPETPITGSLQAVLVSSRPLVIMVDGQQVESQVVGSTVGEALAEAGVALVGLDYSQPDVNEPLPDEGHVSVVRVWEDVLVELQPLPFDTVYQPAPDLEIDNLEVLDPGKYGVLANQVRVRVENGVEVDRRVEEAWEAVAPSPRVLGYGTNIVVRSIDTPDGPIEYWRAIPVYATSYSPCNSGSGTCYPLTASGKTVGRGIIGVIRSWYQSMRGWPVYVPNYGIATIEDIGAGIAGRDWIDLGFNDEEYEVRYGWTTLYFLTPAPPLDYILWTLP
jgi:uncharacterized protein YabE (DUF348 family)